MDTFRPSEHQGYRPVGRYVGVYVIGEEAEGPVKIGKAHDIRARLESLQCGNPRSLLVFGAFYVCDRGKCRGDELELTAHRELTKTGFRMCGEWYDIFADEAVEFLAKVVARQGWQFMPLSILSQMTERRTFNNDVAETADIVDSTRGYSWLATQLRLTGDRSVDWIGSIDFKDEHAALLYCA